MKVCEYHHKPVGMRWGLRFHRYSDGHAALLIYDNETTPREVSLTSDMVRELQEVLRGIANFTEV